MLTIVDLLHLLPWEEAFSHNALEKARRYAHQDRVQIQELDDTTIRATCKGSQGNVYHQIIGLVEDPDGDFELDCICS